MAREIDGWIVIFGCYFFGGILLREGFRMFRAKRQIEDLSTSKIGTAVQGLVEFQGRARACEGKVFVALDGTAVVHSKIEVQVLKTGKSGGWTTRWSYEVGEEFLLEDSSGVAYVNVKGADFFVEKETTDWRSVADDRRAAFVSNSCGNIGFVSEMAVGKWRIIEKKISVGESVLVIGKFETRASEPMVDLSDSLTGIVRKVRSSGMVMKDEVHRLLIADGTQTQILKRVRWGFAIMLLGAVMLTAGIVFTLYKIQNHQSQSW